MKTTHSTGFSLVEVTIALAIVAFGMVVLMGLLPTGLNMVKESSDESAASNILSAVSADIRNIPAGSNNTPIYNIPVWSSTQVTSGTARVDSNGSSAMNTIPPHYAVVWKVIPKSSTDAYANPVYVSVRVSWPADAPQPSGSVETIVSLAKQAR